MQIHATHAENGVFVLVVPEFVFRTIRKTIVLFPDQNKNIYIDHPVSVEDGKTHALDGKGNPPLSEGL